MNSGWKWALGLGAVGAGIYLLTRGGSAKAADPASPKTDPAKPEGAPFAPIHPAFAGTFIKSWDPVSQTGEQLSWAPSIYRNNSLDTPDHLFTRLTSAPSVGQRTGAVLSFLVETKDATQTRSRDNRLPVAVEVTGVGPEGIDVKLLAPTGVSTSEPKTASVPLPAGTAWRVPTFQSLGMASAQWVLDAWKN